MEKGFEKYIYLSSESAKKYNVVSDVHHQDYIFQFLVNNQSFQSEDDAVEYYFNDASNSAKKLSYYISEICNIKDKKFELLEFASGYGCVTRHLANELKDAIITSCDIHKDAVNFIEDKIGNYAIISNSKPELFTTPINYDVIFALSFFSHMPKETWGRWLMSLVAKLKDNGFIIFTTHGLKSRKCFNYPDLDEEGFWFLNSSSEQKDINTDEYGQTIVQPKYVFNKIFCCKCIRLIMFQEAVWWGHQDLYIVKKSNEVEQLDIKATLNNRKALFIKKNYSIGTNGFMNDYYEII